jgi:molybdate transport system regulatory protein
MRANKIELHASLWLTVGDENFGGLGRIRLLENIAEQGSITKAARAMKMSYKAAWDAVDLMNHLAGEPLVERQVGGKGGGGTVLTARGKRLVENFKHIKQEHFHFIEHLNTKIDNIAEDVMLITRVGMKTSARNQFLGRVTALREDGVNVHVALDIGSQLNMVATITKASADDLKLSTGVEAFVIFKANAVTIDADNMNSDNNVNSFHGVVTHLTQGKDDCDLTIEIADDKLISATPSKAQEDELELTLGKAVNLHVNPANIIIAIPI